MSTRVNALFLDHDVIEFGSGPQHGQNQLFSLDRLTLYRWEGKTYDNKHWEEEVYSISHFTAVSSEKIDKLYHADKGEDYYRAAKSYS